MGLCYGHNVSRIRRIQTHRQHRLNSFEWSHVNTQERQRPGEVSWPANEKAPRDVYSNHRRLWDGTSKTWQRRQTMHLLGSFLPPTPVTLPSANWQCNHLLLRLTLVVVMLLEMSHLIWWSHTKTWVVKCDMVVYRQLQLLGLMLLYVNVVQFHDELRNVLVQ